MTQIPQHHPLAKGTKYGLVILATAFLNIGLFPITYVLTPLFAGIVCGFLVGSTKKAVLGGYLGAFIVFVPLEILTAPGLMDYLVQSGALTMAEIQEMILVFYLLLILAASLISILGATGGLLGSKLKCRHS